MATLRLLSRDNHVFEVDAAIAGQSATIRNIVEDVGEEAAHTIPVPQVHSATLAKVLEYCTFHHHRHSAATTAAATTAATATDAADQSDQDFDAAFVDVDTPALLELVAAANYLDIKPLLQLTCAAVAGMIRGKTPEEIRQHFGIENDFTPEEEEQVRQEHLWIACE